MIVAPVVLFVYNRPLHTQKTLDSLARAHLSQETLLYVYCDGPKSNANDQEKHAIELVREIVCSENRLKGTIINISDSNNGLGNSVIRGVSEVLARHNSVIILEDDILIHHDFLIFMNYYLNEYKTNKRVMHISGFQRNSFMQFFLPRIFFARYMDCWGWATWADRWELLITDLNFLDKYLSIEYNLRKFNYTTVENSNQLDNNREGLKTWAIFWYATIAVYNGLCLKPRFSYTKNIGNDGSGSNNTVSSDNLPLNYTSSFVKKLIEPKESLLGRIYIRDAYSKKSKKRFNLIKKTIFIFLSSIRKIFIKSSI